MNQESRARRPRVDRPARPRSPRSFSLSPPCCVRWRFPVAPAIQTGRASYNPAADMKGVLKTRKVEHRSAISQGELPDFLKKLDSYSGYPITKLALRLIVLTFVRTGELRGARWEEFDVDQGEWRIPAERMKMRSPHIVPLSPQALAVVEDLRPLTGHFDLLFPSQRDQGKPISENTLLYALYRLGYHKRATVHGFRALASTILNETGFLMSDN